MGGRRRSTFRTREAEPNMPIRPLSNETQPDSSFMRISMGMTNLNNDDGDKVSGYEPSVFYVNPRFWEITKAFDDILFETIARRRPISFLRECCMLKGFRLPQYVVGEPHVFRASQNKKYRAVLLVAGRIFDADGGSIAEAKQAAALFALRNWESS